MSTDIKQIIGLHENRHNPDWSVDYAESDLIITSFYGGANRGSCLQLTINQSNGYVAYTQLTKDQVKELIQSLKNWIK